MAALDVLRTELFTDPEALGYGAATDEQAAALLNSVATGRTRNKATMTASDVLNAVVKSEYLALTAAKQQLMWSVLAIGELNPFGIEADLFVEVFGGGSETITALQVARKETVSRAAELGIGIVKTGHVARARGEE